MEDNILYWDGYPSTELKFTQQANNVIVLFTAKDSVYGCLFSGKINLSLTTDLQVVSGNVEYAYKSGSRIESYELKGAFESTDFDYFKGTWSENGESSPFELFWEKDNNNLIKSAVDTVELISSNDVDEDLNKDSPIHYRVKKRRAVRRDAKVKNIQRKIELEYGLPDGSVKLFDPNGKISPLAKISTLRYRWED